MIQGHVLSPWKRLLHSFLLPILPLLLEGDSPVSWTLIRSILTLELHPVVFPGACPHLPRWVTQPASSSHRDSLAPTCPGWHQAPGPFLPVGAEGRNQHLTGTPDRLVEWDGLIPARISCRSTADPSLWTVCTPCSHGSHTSVGPGFAFSRAAAGGIFWGNLTDDREGRHCAVTRSQVLFSRQSIFFFNLFFN